MGVAMMGVMHIYFKFTQPLFIQSLMTLKNVYDAKLVQIYIVGKEAKDDLQRPFKSPSLFGGAHHSDFFSYLLMCHISRHRSKNRCCLYCRGRETSWQER